MRALGCHIKGTNGKSQGVVPFLKVVNDTAVAVNQGGKRKGAVCAYLETWHLDIEEFLELRKNTGDDRRRTHDMNTANWIPDLFMKRVMEDGEWTLFSPSDVPDLHDKFGTAFEEAYIALRGARPRAASSSCSRRCRRRDLWRKMLSMLFETGHPWITFKDACNVRSPQQHVGVVHSSNLCTEITLNTSDARDRGLQPRLGQPAAHLDSDGALDHGQAEAHVAHGDAHARQRHRHQLLRGQARRATRNLRHRPVGLGIMGFQDCLHLLRMPYASRRGGRVRRPLDGSGLLLRLLGLDRAGRGARPLLELHAARCGTAASCRRTRSSCWPSERGGYVEVDTLGTLDWDALRERISEHGMRNSNCVAIAPTATISNIIGVVASIEPTYQNLYVKSNLSGEFTVVNEYLVRDLKRARPVGRGDGRRPQVLRRLAARRSTACPAELRGALRHRLRGRAAVAGRSARRAARSGSTRRSRSTSTWPAPRARSSTRPTSSPGCAA